jgi:hypothetical protein
MRIRPRIMERRRQQRRERREAKRRHEIEKQPHNGQRFAAATSTHRRIRRPNLPRSLTLAGAG